MDYAFVSGVSFLLLTLSIVTDGEDRGENCGLCLQIWRLFPVVNTKHSQTAKTEARTVDYAFEFGVSFLLLILSIVTDGEDRGENCGLCLQIWRLFPVVNTKHSHRR